MGNGQEEGYDTDDDNPLRLLRKQKHWNLFSSHVIPVKTVKVYLGECNNIMVQALHTQDGTLLLDLTVQNTCTELRKGGKKEVLMVWNNTTYSQTLWKKIPVARTVPTLPVPEPPESKSLQDKDDTHPNLQTPKLMVRQRHGKLFDELDLRGLDSWAPELTYAACQLLAKCRDIFSLDLAELGCTHSTEHTIKVTDNTPFKEWFR